MKTIQMTLDEDLLNRVIKAIREQNTTRSVFIRESLQYYLERIRIKKLKKKHRDGYLAHPVKAGEFDIWEEEQAWQPNEWDEDALVRTANFRVYK